MTEADHTAPDDTAPDEDARRDFVRAHTRLRRPPGLPELELHLTDALTPLWEATEATLAERGVAPPFWAFAWAGGLALARWLFDHPGEVAGRRVLDLGCGSGLLSIAALRLGAAHALAVDVDAFALAAAGLNARANGVEVERLQADLLDAQPPPCDLVLVGDLAYEQPTTDRVRAFLRRAHARGARVLLGDPGRVYFSRGGLVRLAEYNIATDTEIEELDSKRTSVWEMV